MPQLMPLDAADSFSMRLATDPRFIALIERSRASYKATGGISLAEMRRKYAVPKPRRRAASRKRR